MIDSVVKLVRGAVRVVGGTSNTVIGNVADRMKTEANQGAANTLNNAWPIQLVDVSNNRRSIIDPFRALKVSEATRLCGTNSNQAINPLIWIETNLGSGDTAFGSGLLTQTTGVTANSSTILQTVNPALIQSGVPNAFITGYRLGDTGTVNNERRWGVWTATNGLYFKLAGTAFSICSLKNGVETVIPSASFNGSIPVTDTSFHLYEIYYTPGLALFYRDREILHTLTATGAALCDTMHLPIRYENKNVSGGTTNCTAEIRENMVYRFGKHLGTPRAFHANVAGTTVIKNEPGTVHGFILNRNGGVGSTTFQLYDNNSAAGTLLYQVTLGSNMAVSHKSYIDFRIGLTMVVPNNSEVTLEWE